MSPQRNYRVQMTLQAIFRKAKKEIHPFLHRHFQKLEKEGTFPEVVKLLFSRYSLPRTPHLTDAGFNYPAFANGQK